MLSPLRFDPYLRPRIWGGTRLRDRLGRQVPPGEAYGESWELSALPEHDSVVADGPLQGMRLSELWNTRRAELWGDSPAPYGGDRFPLLIKWLDCNELLSVQVHPDDAGAQRLIGEPCGKAEAWVFLEVTPGATAYFGLRSGTSPQEFERRMLDGTVEQCLATIHPQPGEVINVPPGSVHALGAGQLLLEVEQPSDATFRVYDYNRPGPDGKPRQLHHAESLASIDWNRHAPPPLEPKLWPDAPGLRGETLVRSPAFSLHRVQVHGRCAVPFAGRMSSWTVIDGDVDLSSGDGEPRPLKLGDTVLIPASCNDADFIPAAHGATLIGATV